MRRALVAAAILSTSAFVAVGGAPRAAAQSRRPLEPADIFELKTVSDPRISPDLSPDGAWVAYTVSSLDKKEDNSDTDVYMAPIEPGRPSGAAIKLTSSKKPETSPRWSPDGRYLAFLSGRDGKKTQVYLLDRRGGDAQQLTDYKTGASAIAWSPDSSRLALLVSDPDPDDPNPDADAKDKKPKPHVITRLQFMRDGEGYLNDVKRHVHVFDVAAKKDLQITSDKFDDADPVELATQLWALGHGGVTLQLARLLSPEQAASCLVGALLNLFASFGAGPDVARRSIETGFSAR